MSNIKVKEGYVYLFAPTNIYSFVPNATAKVDMFNVHVGKETVGFENVYIDKEVYEQFGPEVIEEQIKEMGIEAAIATFRGAYGYFYQSIAVLQIPSNCLKSSNESTSPKPMLTHIDKDERQRLIGFEITQNLILGAFNEDGEYIENPNYTTDYDPKEMIQMPVLDSPKGRKPRQ